MKPKLHIHSDNAEWAGCENMPGIFLQDKMINSKFEVSFSYRYTPEYERGMKKWVSKYNPLKEKLGCDGFDDIFVSQKIKTFPMNFPITHIYSIAKYFRPIMVLGIPISVIEVVKFVKLLRRVQPDILHLNNGGFPGASTCNSAVIAAGLLGVPKITYMINSTTRDMTYWRPITKLVKRYVTRFVTASKHLANNSKFLCIDNNIIYEDVELEHNEPIETDNEIIFNIEGKVYGSIYERLSNFIVIPNTVKYKESIPKGEVRKYLGIRDDEVMFLCCGVLEHRKGFHVAIEAFNKLQGDKPRSLVIAGRGGQESRIRAMMQQSSAKIILYQRDYHEMKFGRVIDDYSLINACDVLIVPSLSDEDFPNVILIAMMYGKSVIASRLAGIPEQAAGGFLVSIGSIEDLKITMNTCLGSETRKVFGKESKEKFDKCFSNEVVIQKWIDLWESKL